MASNKTSSPTGELFEDDSRKTLGIPAVETFEGHQTKELPGEEYKLQILWLSVTIFASLHIAALYGVYLIITSASWITLYFTIFLYHCGALGITAGAHRLWSHRSYKAKFPLRVILVLFNTLAYENSVIKWARLHRAHHKFSDTNADPHNAKRGFFFSHIGWLMCHKHPDVLQKRKDIDISDLAADKLLQFQKTYYKILSLIICFISPTLIPVYLWGETWTNAFFVATLFRYALTLNMIFLINSAAHIWGQKPYDQYINPSENIVAAISALGEGWHNYHHAFPWDYKAAELGNYRTNFTTAFIDFMAKIGWAYDLKTVSAAMIKKRVERTGDGSHPEYSHAGEVWGWEDKDLTQEDKDVALITHRESQ